MAKGQKELMDHIKKMSDPDKFFDKDMKTITKKSVRFLVKGTKGKGKIKTGNTARGWTKPRKLSNSTYLVQNKTLTKPSSIGQKRYNIARILDEGHGVIRPKKADRLFIPLTKRGASRGLGYKKEGMKYGKDYVLAKKVKALKGRDFIATSNVNAAKAMVGLMLHRIARS